MSPSSLPFATKRGLLALGAAVGTLVISVACDAVTVKAIPDADGGIDATCGLGTTPIFDASASPGIIGVHENKCTPAQLSSFVKCLHDFDAEEAECKAWGFDPTKSVSSAFSGECATCLFGLPDQSGRVLRVETRGESVSFGLNEAACIEAFLGPACGASAYAPLACARSLCGAEQGCKETAEAQACFGAALSGPCASYVAEGRACAEGARPLDAGADADAGASETIYVGDAATTTREAPVAICGKIGTFTGTSTPDDVTFAFANYFCGAGP